MRAIIAAEAKAISAIAVDDAFEAAVRAMAACKGKVLTTGIGKAGYMASKFAATLCSTATPAHFVHPAEAAHGDLGIVGDQDCIIAFSTSGKSREVLEMLELSRHLGMATIIGVTSHADSPLRDLSDIVLDMGIIEEPCPWASPPARASRPCWPLAMPSR